MHDRVIVTTTINPPTKALKLYAEKENWDMIVVGDLKTPHNLYENIKCTYLDPEFQENKYKRLSDSIGWNCIQRRNIGFIEAFRRGYEIIATVDDDNIPYSDWGENILVNKTTEVDIYTTDDKVFDPLSATNNKKLWHRGFPLELVEKKNEIVYKGKENRKVLIQADLWDGDPDVDAICRLTMKPCVRFDPNLKPFGSDCISPFNSQNTFISREVLHAYACLPHIGRMDDIWGGYIMQHEYPQSVIYSKATVYQERNPQDLIKNLENEIIGYRNSLEIALKGIAKSKILPEKAQNFLKIYQNEFNKTDR